MRMCTVEHEDIKEKAQEFNRVNGNAMISNKEMLIYLMHKQDDMYNQHQKLMDTMKDQQVCCTKRFATKKEMRWLWGSGVGLVSLFLVILQLFL